MKKTSWNNLYVWFMAFIMAMTGMSCESGSEPGVSKTRIAILTGEKSHPATMHEYIKNARLIKAMVENAGNLENITVDIYYGGWPEDPAVLDSVDLILTISDGRDGPGGKEVPFMTDERMKIIQRQMDRGCGMMTFHFSTFTPDKYGPQILDWVGGYFDWQNDQGEREWYSDITYLDEMIELPSPRHPVSSGVEPFQIKEEYYFDLRFRQQDPRFIPVVEVPGLNAEHADGKIVAWALEREDGGRGFGTSLGHFYGNWKNKNYRKLLLNAIVWTAGLPVPDNGVESPYLTDDSVTELLYGTSHKALILTGNNYPGHKWQETTPLIRQAVEKNGRVKADVSHNINDLYQYDLRDYDLLVFNYCNWQDPDPIWDGSKAALVDFVEGGGALMFIHFANGAFHFSLPDAGESDWPYYRKLCRRVWNHHGKSTHDKYGTFEVIVQKQEHDVTRNLTDFQVTDELYYNQEGDEPIEVLLSAVSQDTGKEEPQAWVYEINHYNGRNSRVFQTVMGHDTVSLKVPEFQQLLSNAAIWLARGADRWDDL